jgi:glycosyltransferase involved in cell wall biosynthesis
MKTILHIFRTYSRDSSLFNDIVRSTEGAYRNVVCYLTGADDGDNQMTNIADQIIYLNLDKNAVTWRSPSTVGKVRQIIDDNNVDLVDCHMWRSMPIGVLAAARSRHKPQVVGVFHGVKSRISLRTKLLYYFTLRRMAKIVSVSEGGVADIQSLFWGVDPGKLSAIPNGLDFSRFSGVEVGDRSALFGPELASKRLFITVSRLASKKNLERLLRAFSHVHSAYPNAGLVIVGDGLLRPRLEAFVASKGLVGSVAFLGFRDDVPLLLKTADVYAIPSLREGLPRSLLEAMAVGRPVLASRIHGHEEVVRDPEHGRMVDAADADDIAAAIEYFMRLEPQELEAQGQAASEHVRADFNRDLMMTRYRALFDELLQS